MSRATPAKWHRLRRDLLLLAAALSGPLVVRAALLVEETGPLVRADLAGVLSDLSVALLFAAPLALVARRHPPTALVASLFWGLLHYADYEHVRELGAGINFTFAHYAADPTFLRGSAFAPSRPLLLAVTAALPAAGTWLATRRRAFPVRWLPALAAGGAIAIAVQALPTDDQVFAWRQRHFLVEGLEATLTFPGPGEGARGFAPPLELAADLAGRPRIPLPGSARNVVLVMLEALPATAVEPLAAIAGKGRNYVMPHLTEIAERNVFASNFVLHQRQTNRGVYSLLCGDYPKLDHSLAKMTAYVNESSRDCLPRVLAAASYETAYLQGAPLAFMYKDAFAQRAGFDRVYGNKDFADPIHRSYWGVDDRTLLRRAVELTRELESAGSPWFLALLTVGTHHPTVVPRSFLEQTSKKGFEAAAEYLDGALGEFVDSLEAAGILEDALVFITVDESRGDDSLPNLRNALSRNWGPLVILLPEKRQFVIEEPFGQSDIALSILDYLGIDARQTEFVGRSVFREYATSRRVYFSNVFLRKLGGVDGAGFVFHCVAGARRCPKYAANPSSLFVPRSTGTNMGPTEVAALNAAIRYSRREGEAHEREFSFELVGESVIPLIDGPSQALMGGQNFHIPAGSRIDVEIDLRVEGLDGTVAIKHHLNERFHGDHLREPIGELGPGDSATIRYSYLTPRAMKNVKIKLIARAHEPRDLSVHFAKARMHVEPLQTAIEKARLLHEPQIEVRRAPSGA
jgi:hypothetical protein